jgi:hypothetical protein
LAAPNSSAQTNQDRFLGVQYLAGHAGLDSKVAGHLLLTDDALVFTTSDTLETPIIITPLASITEVTSAVDRKEASVGSKIMFGFLARSRKEELVQVTTTVPTGAEGIVFQVRKNESVGIVAKIHYRMTALNDRGGVTTQDTGKEGVTTPAVAVASLPASSPTTARRPKARLMDDPPPAVHGQLMDDYPEGTQFIGDVTSRTYFPAACPATATIPLTTRLYYRTEANLIHAGFARSPQC